MWGSRFADEPGPGWRCGTKRPRNPGSRTWPHVLRTAFLSLPARSSAPRDLPGSGPLGLFAISSSPGRLGQPGRGYGRRRGTGPRGRLFPDRALSRLSRSVWAPPRGRCLRGVRRARRRRLMSPQYVRAPTALAAPPEPGSPPTSPPNSLVTPTPLARKDLRGRRGRELPGDADERRAGRPSPFPEDRGWVWRGSGETLRRGFFDRPAPFAQGPAPHITRGSPVNRRPGDRVGPRDGR